MSDDTYQDIGYGAMEIGFGERPGILVVDFQTGFTQPEFPLGNCPLVHRAVENTARVLEAARAARVPVANCYTAYHSERDMPYWKIAPVRENFFEGDACAEMEPRTSDADYDYILRKSGPSIFFQTPVTSFLTKHGVDTTIVMGCMTSGCIRASVIDSFSHGYRTMVPRTAWATPTSGRIGTTCAMSAAATPISSRPSGCSTISTRSGNETPERRRGAGRRPAAVSDKES